MGFLPTARSNAMFGMLAYGGLQHGSPNTDGTNSSLVIFFARVFIHILDQFRKVHQHRRRPLSNTISMFSMSPISSLMVHMWWMPILLTCISSKKHPYHKIG